MTKIKKDEVKRIVYIEENNQVKAHKCIINNIGEVWVDLQFVDEETLGLVGTRFLMPVHFILKIKDIKEEKDANN